MTQHTLFVCTLCRFSESNQAQNETGNPASGGEQLLNHVTEAVNNSDWGDQIQVQPVRCMAVCHRSCVVAFAASQKLTFIFSGLSPQQSIPDLMQFGKQYTAHPTGNVPYGERPAAMKRGLVAVLPPVSAQPT
jgi:predicted metal-binding protein